MAIERRKEALQAEELWLQRARSGEDEAFDCLFRQHKDAVYACLWNLLDGEADVVEEAVGNVFLNAYRGLKAFRRDSSFSTWLYRIAVNEAHARIRQKRRQRLLGWFSLDDRDLPKHGFPQSSDPAEGVLRSEDGRILRQAVRALPEPYRTPTVLRYMSGLDSAAIAEVLKRPRGTVRYQLSRALGILRERLGSEWTA